MAKPKLVGRQPDYTPEAFNLAVQLYFKELKKLPTKAGLLFHLDISRETWRNYKNKGGIYLDTIRWAEAQIEDAWLQQLAGPGATGPIFYLKNAFKEEYKDRQETDITSAGEKLQITGMIISKD